MTGFFRSKKGKIAATSVVCAVLAALIVTAACLGSAQSENKIDTAEVQTAESSQSTQSEVSAQASTVTEQAAETETVETTESLETNSSSESGTQSGTSQGSTSKTEQQSGYQTITNAKASEAEVTEEEPQTSTTATQKTFEMSKNFLSNMTDNMTDDEREVLYEILNAVESHQIDVSIKDGVIRRNDTDALSDMFLVVKSALACSDVLESGYSFSGGEYVTHIKLGFKLTEEEYSEQTAKTKAAVNEIISAMGTNLSDYEKIKYICDSIADRCSYSIDDTKTANSAYGCLVLGKAGCEGYAKAFMLLCEKAELPCVIVTGTAKANGLTVNHMWNKVKLSSGWYNVDACWDDSSYEGVYEYDYFLVGDSEIESNHQAEANRFYQYPDAAVKTDNYYVKNALLADTAEEAQKVVLNAFVLALRTDRSCASIKLSSDSAYEKALEAIDSESLFAAFMSAAKKVGVEASANSFTKLTNSDMRTITFVFDMAE